MSIYVEGSYANVEDAIRAVDTLIMRGHEKDAVTLIHNQTHQEEQLDALDIAVKKMSELTNQENHRLGKHVEDLKDGRFVLQVTESDAAAKEHSTDLHSFSTDDDGVSTSDPAVASDNEAVQEDAELLEDVRNSEVDPSNNQSNEAIGYSSDLNTSEDTPLDNGPDRTL